MTIEEFAELTRRVIARDGFDGFQPTGCFPARRHIATLAGVPADVDVEAACLRWAESKVEPGEEFLVAFKSGLDTVTIVRRFNKVLEQASFKLGAA